MNLRRFIAMAAAMALTGLTQELAAEENLSPDPDSGNAQQISTEQKSETEILITETEQSGQSALSSPDTLLSELKVYPSF